MRRSAAVWVFLLFELAIVLGLWHFAPIMAPVKECDSAKFWRRACHIDLDDGEPDGGFGGGIHPPQGEYLVCYDQGFHGTLLYRVRRAEAEEDFPRVVRRLDNGAPFDGDWPRIATAYNVWKANGGADRQDMDGFLACLRDARLASWATQDGRDVFEYLLDREKQFAVRWRRTHRYWANIAFEFGYLSLLALFLLWPWLRRKGMWAWCTHLALFPFLLLLPCYLGYSEFTFTSAGPSGGVLYPWLIVWTPGARSWMSLDAVFFEAIPRVLEPLNQRLGPMLSMSGGAIGVASTSKWGLVLGCVPLAVVWMRRFWRARRSKS